MRPAAGRIKHGDHPAGTDAVDQKRYHLETQLLEARLDFSAEFLCVQALNRLLQAYPERAARRSIAALSKILEENRHEKQKQAYFLFKQTADVFISIILGAMASEFADLALSALRQHLGRGSQACQRAVSEALGGLPLKIEPVSIHPTEPIDIPSIEWEALAELAGISSLQIDAGRWLGRSFIIPRDRKTCVVIKWLRRGESPQSIDQEALWMICLQNRCRRFPVRFDIPVPIQIDNSCLFRFKRPPSPIRHVDALDPEYHAICFISHPDYFIYPNDDRDGRQLATDQFEEIMLRNSWLLGKMTALGVVHTAPIPLFHNRVQSNRRDDLGVFEWFRGGRLDRWLDSCRFPNFGRSGLRDFEHFEPLSRNPNKLYERIGSHLLSLLLVTGSFFRNREPCKKGFDHRGSPIDARHLFDRRFLQQLIQKIFLHYYNGFTGLSFDEVFPVNLEHLTSRMIDEMGIDRHMEEILRVPDQQAMTHEAFSAFLAQRGFTRNQISRIQKGRKDISIMTGPHLGGFNQKISLPEIIEFIAAASAICISKKFNPGRTHRTRQCATGYSIP